ncbi:MAG: HAD-IC family P-type ATPase [Clostridia bacterium]|nr:HAD-IC family P-type ATPase [Clostridia bacterium]
MKKRKNLEVVRYNTEPTTGLTRQQVEERKLLGLVNKTKQNSGKSFFTIFVQNICTFFNLIWAVVIVALLAVESYNDLFFIIVIVLNTTIAIIQEIKAKVTVEKLSYVTAPKLTVIRDGKEEKILATKLCLDDIVKLSIGNQIPTDCILLSGKVEMNESMLTGESQAVKKQEGDTLFAGSYIISGGCFARVDKVGTDSYIQTVATQAKKFKSPQSNLFKDINNLIKYIGIIIIPVAGIMFVNNYFSYGRDLSVAIIKTCGSVTGMVPAGMFLLITIALSLGVIKLGKKKTLVQDIYSIEMLARTNVLCLDKTGTITDGTMRVCEHINLKQVPNITNEMAISNILNAQHSSNQTSNAMLLYYKKENSLFVTQNIEFSSKRKFTATSFDGVGTFAMGAPEFLHVGTLNPEIENLMISKMKDGKRVLLLAHSPQQIVKDELPYYMEPMAIIVLEDHIRDDAIETIKWFKNNDVQIKIISGDNPYTVANIAKRVGIENADACISLEGMSLKEVQKIAGEFTVFGRVSPEQKHALIKALKTAGNTVAMTGDGVNDSLALKEADCSIAMADGSEVARNLSNIVLLDSKFSSLPAVVKEGRQVINNVQQSSTLFLMKTVFTILLSLTTILTRSQYPFSPSQLLLLEMFIIGLPSVILAIQPNDKLIKGDFTTQVLKRALPNGLLMFFNILIVIALNNIGLLNPEEYTSISTLVLLGTGFVNLVYLCVPFNTLRLICVGLSAVCVTVASFTLGQFFGITSGSLIVVLIFIILVGISIPLHIYIPKLSDFIFEKLKQLEAKTKQKKEAKQAKKAQAQQLSFLDEDKPLSEIDKTEGEE